MKSSEFKQFLSRISDLIRDILDITSKMTLDDFRRNEETKERVYFMLQELGQNANEAIGHFQGDEFESNLLSILKSLDRARFNLESEVNDQMVFSIIRNDFPEIQQTLRKFLFELQTE